MGTTSTMNQTIRLYVMSLLSRKGQIPFHRVRESSDLGSLNLSEHEFMELVFDIEDEFEIEFPAIHWKYGFLHQFRTLEDIVGVVERLIQQKNLL